MGGTIGENEGLDARGVDADAEALDGGIPQVVGFVFGLRGENADFGNHVRKGNAKFE